MQFVADSLAVGEWKYNSTYFLKSRLHRCFGNSSLNKLKAIVLGLSKLQSLDCESCLLVKHVRATILARDPHHTNSPFARPFRYLGL